MSFWVQAREVARVDFMVERRLGDTLRVIVPFSIVALIVFPLAMGSRLSLIAEVGPALFWALGILFGMQVALRHSATETSVRRDLQTLLGLDPAARLVGRVLSGSVLMIGLLVTLFVAMVVLYGPDLPEGSWLLVALSTLLFAIGLTTLSVLAGEVTIDLRNRAPLASLIVAPLSLPLVVGASQGLEALGRGTSILPWVLLMIATDLAISVAALALAGTLEEASR